jgi:hypothetical protein
MTGIPTHQLDIDAARAGLADPRGYEQLAVLVIFEKARS